MSKGCPHGSCLGPGLWIIFYNSLLNLQFKSGTKIISFADDFLLLTRGNSVSELGNTANTELQKISKWARGNKVRFNEKKSRTMLMTRRNSKEREDLELYLNNKLLLQVKTKKYNSILV